jgi:hypothetical protein
VTKRDKRILAMRRNPKNVRPDQLDAVMRAAGFEVRQEGTSHRVYSLGTHIISVPQRHPFLLRTYVKEALTLIEATLEEASTDEES